MYFPYLRARLAELLAIRDSHSLTDLTVPIFEPVDENPLTYKRLQTAIDKERRFAVIVNSEHGIGAPPATEWVVNAIHKLQEERVFPAVEIRRDTDDVLVRDFATTFRGRTCVVVHRSHPHSLGRLSTCLGPLGQEIFHVILEGAVPVDSVRRLPGRACVLLRDGFKRTTPNKDYPPESDFDTHLYTFRKRGLDGFGDFTTVGDWFPERRPALASTLAYHLTEAEPPKIVTKHFKSWSSTDSGDKHAQYGATREQILEYADRYGINTQGIKEFRNHPRWPNHASTKRYSIVHHLEVIEREMAKMGLTPFL